ncbi:MAG: glycosyl hydrolase 115 family protein [Treponema sp.]|nr:glycosyl hydrolase 115 family protein [Treponema sp.]MCL2250511.1 glycosyl hydrolase 115 family protein [Treponema sp.]
MNKFSFTIETEAFEGVKRIAKKVASDFEKVIGVFPDITESLLSDAEISIIFATLGKSPITDKLIKENKFDPAQISGKREVYQIKLIKDSAQHTSKILLICGSDKRGTIYGMFALSEFIGVSPLHYWGDAVPVRKEKIEITENIETVSKEPSIKYRGFFINDEWPCFGNWTFEHFNGFTAEMYDHVFELLLRLKGNYLWPAMWSSSFPLDGPGQLSEELADIYGVVIGNSHHEPCLRASEEWNLVKGPESEYGNDWNFYTNKKGLIKYWEESLKRSGKYEKIITIGMRGEHDSSMLGSNASLKENIDLLKDIIKNQRELIKKHIDVNTTQMLALYKEVEEYFYGDDNAEGLINWNELDDVIFMLCEDNFGFIRTLPAENIRNRKSGFGMYYHFDYHGGPVSYEWMPSAAFEKTWEQMCMAYDYGIKDVWIVNAGDLKFNEIPLTYFMELAYDFEKWGTNSPNSIDRYISMWLEKTFPAVNTEIREKMASVLHKYIKMNAMRRPEALNLEIYHPCHYLEADRMLNLANDIEKLNEEVFSGISHNEKDARFFRDAYYSMIYFPAKISINLIRMHLYAGKNRHFANQGKKIANKYAALVTECMEKDRALSEEFALFKNGKWKGMELAQHIGFTKWNEDNCRYPLRIQVEPVNHPRMIVSRKDREEIYTKNYGRPMTVDISDFLYARNTQVILEIANDGIGSLNYIIETEEHYDWLEISPIRGTVEYQEEVTIRFNKEKLNNTSLVIAHLLIKDGTTTVAAEIKAKNTNTENLPPMTFLENNGVIAIEAHHYCGKKDVQHGNVTAGFLELHNYGRSPATNGMKVFPTTLNHLNNNEMPFLTYRFLIEETGKYNVEIWTTPTNSVQPNRPLRFTVLHKNDYSQIISVPLDYHAGNCFDVNWCNGVLNNIRINKTSFIFEQGIQEISIGAMEAGLIVERILIYKEGRKLLKSYLGPQESFYVK